MKLKTKKATPEDLIVLAGDLNVNSWKLSPAIKKHFQEFADGHHGVSLINIRNKD